MLCCFAAKANETRDESEFFAIVNETGGYISQSLHTEFWEMMKAKYKEEQRAIIVADTQSALEALKEFQLQTWKSAKESYYAKKVEKTAEYLPLKKRLEQQKSQYFSPYLLINNAEKMIEAAATRSALDLGAGKFYITPELIEENIIGMNGSYERLKVLLAPVWKAEYKEYLLPKIKISLLSLYAPDEYHEIITQGNETIDMHIAQLSVDKNAMYEIGAIDYQKEDKKFTDLTPQERNIYLQAFIQQQFAGYKVDEPSLSKGTWRGHEFTKGVATVDDYNIVIMGLFVNDKALYIKYVTDANLSSANSDFNEFTKRIQILERI